MDHLKAFRLRKISHQKLVSIYVGFCSSKPEFAQPICYSMLPVVQAS